MTEKDIIEYVRQDMVNLSKEMKQGFQKLEEKIDKLREEYSEDNDKITENCSQKRAEIYQRIEANRQSIEQLDKKFVRLFFIGSGFGFVAGVVTTVVITRVMGGG